MVIQFFTFNFQVYLRNKFQIQKLFNNFFFKNSLEFFNVLVVIINIILSLYQTTFIQLIIISSAIFIHYIKVYILYILVIKQIIFGVINDIQIFFLRLLQREILRFTQVNLNLKSQKKCVKEQGWFELVQLILKEIVSDRFNKYQLVYVYYNVIVQKVVEW
eukprot:TRINITY_DN3335_c0_g1_i1.p4 TRINITY_DN3335_c0_g1~~TRINITY_DN3335_c0_g1_i1.p4  ORF type:complete len:161 (-),score=0.19 TRINITY_DN3335_c0_g1_i1:205-687(-)